ncbi:MAG: polymorphic toxin-type HINT domain-containing protein [Aureispira sp.]
MFHYHPFGWQLDTRSFSSDMYRFGFNGKENDADFGNQLIQDYGFRLYNPAIAKFLSVDPLAPEYPFHTPYQFAGNKPIKFIDLDGLEEAEPSFLESFSVTTIKMVGNVYVQINNNPAHAGHSVKPQKITKEQIEDYAIDWRNQLNPYYQIESFADGVVTTGVGVYKFGEGIYEGDGAKAAENLPYALAAATGVYGGASKLFRKKPSAGSGVRLPNPCGCFIAGTIVKTKVGDSNIEDIKVGDWVWAYDDSTGITELKQVLQLHRYTRDTIYKIYIDDEVIETTADHPFYVNGLYVVASKLLNGDTLRTKDNTYYIIDSIQTEDGLNQVYNFTVDDYHTYFVGEEGVLVHNSGPCDFMPTKYKEINKEIKQVIGGKGTPRRNNDNTQKIFGAREYKRGKEGYGSQKNWEGAREWEVSNTKGKHLRILEKNVYDKSGKHVRTDYGWSEDVDYKKIHKFKPKED